MDQDFSGAPFHLDAEGIAWVESTLARLSGRDRLAQLLVPLARDLSPAALDHYLTLGLGGIHRLSSRGEADLLASARYLAAGAAARGLPPLCLTADLDFSEKNSLKDGTAFTNQMGVAATNDPAAAGIMGRLCAEEMQATGGHWTFSPVVDLSLNPRSSVVNTRAFSDRPEVVASMAAAHVGAVEAGGVVATPKHWPGDGTDDRDQHYATTDNHLSVEDWRRDFAPGFAAAIAAGARSIMAGHITQKALSRAMGPDATARRHLPATLNPDLLAYLRREMGFKGVIISDSLQMGGFNSQGIRRDLLPACLAAGCDVLLFPAEPVEDDLGHLVAALADGRLTEARVAEACRLMLALKASLGLHRGEKLAPTGGLGTEAHRAMAEDVARRSITCVRNDEGLLPLSPARHPRLLLLTPAQRLSPGGPLPALDIAALLTTRGFTVTRHDPALPVDLTNQDLALYAFEEEGMSGKFDLRIRWDRIQAPWHDSLRRLWHEIPTVMLSFGSPYTLLDAPECRTVINAYSPVASAQRAAIAALCGEIAFAGVSPVDPRRGLYDAERAL